MALKKNVAKYSSFWDVSGIEIRKVSQLNGETIECTETNYPNCNDLKLVPTNTGTGVSNFVSLCRKERIEEFISDKCEVARLIVTYNGDNQ